MYVNFNGDWLVPSNSFFKRRQCFFFNYLSHGGDMINFGTVHITFLCIRLDLIQCHWAYLPIHWIVPFLNHHVGFVSRPKQVKNVHLKRCIFHEYYTVGWFPRQSYVAILIWSQITKLRVNPKFENRPITNFFGEQWVKIDVKTEKLFL